MGLIFKYELKDAWFYELYKIEIFDDKKENVVITDNTDDDEEEIVYKESLSDYGVNRIKDLITEKILNLKDEDMEDTFVLDGTMNDVFVSKDRKENRIITDNLWAHLKHESVNGKMLAEFVLNIKKVLEAEHINVTNFKLDF